VLANVPDAMKVPGAGSVRLGAVIAIANGRTRRQRMLQSKTHIALACVLSALAGYVDGIGFIHLGGLFVSFMSGNSTRLGVTLADGHYGGAGEALGLIAMFVLGSAIGSLIATGKGRYRQALILLVETLLLAAAAGCYMLGRPTLAIAAIVLAMGLENSVFQVGGGAGIGLTYMTGALVKVGQGLATAITGGPRWTWLPNLLLWAALVAGSLLGAIAYHRINLLAIWFAAGITLVLCIALAVAQWRLGRRELTA
jgi:uncharacterized membrane protein YoaK (UPF0700 family)